MRRLALVLALLPALAAAQGTYLGHGHYSGTPLLNDELSRQEINKANRDAHSPYSQVTECDLAGIKTRDECHRDTIDATNASLEQGHKRMVEICGEYVKPDGTYPPDWKDCPKIIATPAPHYGY